MTPRGQRINETVRVVCVAACFIAAALFLVMFVGLGVDGIRRHAFSPHELGLPIALAIIGLLTFFSAFAAWRFWRRSLSSNGGTMLPPWFFEVFSHFFVAGSAFYAYYHPSYLLLWAVAVSFLIYLARTGRNRKREFDHDG
jgi:hypothetical protein